MRTPCSVTDCEEFVNSGCLCLKHVMRLRRTGSVDLRPREAKKCAVEGCASAHHAQGYCAVHNARHNRTGDPLATRRETTTGSFWKRVRGAGVEDCWQWTGFVLASGYGQIASRVKPTSSGTRLAHRVAYELLIGDIPEGLVLDHLCRNRTCVNPWHLDPVTPLVNTRRGLRVPASVRAMYGAPQGVGR